MARAMALRHVAPALALLSCALGSARAYGADEPAVPRWAAHLEAVGKALDRGDVSAALQEWRLGYAAALRSRTWLGLIEVGDAVLRIAEAGGLRGSAKPVARHLYLEALVQAKSRRSPEGALRAAAGFDRLGDRVVVEQCVRVAETAARRLGDADALHRVATVRRRLAHHPDQPPDLTRMGDR